MSVRRALRSQVINDGRVFEAQPVVCGKNLKGVVKGQKCLQQILFVERNAFFNQPFRRIIVREKDVMHMHHHTRGQRRKNFQKFMTHVTSELHGMTGIDEQDIASPQPGEQLKVEALDRLFYHLHFDPSLGQSWLRIRFDTNQIPLATFGSILPERFVRDASRVTTSNLNHTTRFQITEHRVVKCRVEAAEVIVFKIKALGFRQLSEFFNFGTIPFTKAPNERRLIG